MSKTIYNEILYGNHYKQNATREKHIQELESDSQQCVDEYLKGFQKVPIFYYNQLGLVKFRKGKLWQTIKKI